MDNQALPLATIVRIGHAVLRYLELATHASSVLQELIDCVMEDVPQEPKRGVPDAESSQISIVVSKWDISFEVQENSFGATVEQVQKETLRNAIRSEDASHLLEAQERLRQELEDDSDDELLTDED